MIGRALIAMAALAASCGAGGATAGAQVAAAAPEQAARPFRPVVDHHLHLLSPAGAALATPPLLPEIALPEGLANLVRERNRRWNDQAALAEIYAEDALYYRGGTSGWVQGRAAAAGYAKWTISDTPYRIKPVAYNLDGASARIAGYFVEADGSDRHFGSFLFAAVKGSDGVWRIAAENYVYQGAPQFESAHTAAQLVAEMDAAGVRRGVVLSDAYYFDSVRPEPVPDEYGKVRAENDWTAEQVARFPDRLVAFCSFNPLQGYALAELERCAASCRFRGLKLHFNAAQLKFRDPREVAKVRRVMEAANRHRLPMIIHVRPGYVYGREEAEIFLHQLIAAAPDVPIQIAHLWGGENFSAAALEVYARAVAARDPATRNLYFDISGAAHYAQSDELPQIAVLIRRIGMGRILYGSDAPIAETWQALQTKLPLTEAEFRAIAGNVAPYMTTPAIPRARPGSRRRTG
jgi:predicted TIM-barrel fold metal-dependent hydrolase